MSIPYYLTTHHISPKTPPQMEISKAKIKLIAKLRDRKQRKALGIFAVEGHKSVADTLPYFSLELLVAGKDWLAANQELAPADKSFSATATELKQMSALTTPTEVIAIYRLPEEKIPGDDSMKGQLTLLLDDIQDPGNLGTIVRCADWFGIRNIVASKHTVDIYNPKAIQATMGALSRVNICYTDLAEFISRHRHIPLYATLLDGRNIYKTDLPQEAMIIMGNEGKGVSAELRKLITDSLFIPPYPPDAETIDSLNVAIATAVVLAEFRKRNG